VTMADHKRKLLRYATARLLSGETSCGDHVYRNRPTPLWEAELPAICVYTLEESPNDELSSMSPRSYMRECQLVTEILAEASENCDDVIDDISMEVEGILFANNYLRDPQTGQDTLDGELDWRGSNISLADTGRRVVASNRIMWTAPYETLAPEPTLAAGLDDFKTAHTELDIDSDGVTDVESSKSIQE